MPSFASVIFAARLLSPRASRACRAAILRSICRDCLIIYQIVDFHTARRRFRHYAITRLSPDFAIFSVRLIRRHILSIIFAFRFRRCAARTPDDTTPLL